MRERPASCFSLKRDRSIGLVEMTVRAVRTGACAVGVCSVWVTAADDRGVAFWLSCCLLLLLSSLPTKRPRSLESSMLRPPQRSAHTLQHPQERSLLNQPRIVGASPFVRDPKGALLLLLHTTLTPSARAALSCPPPAAPRTTPLPPIPAARRLPQPQVDPRASRAAPARRGEARRRRERACGGGAAPAREEATRAPAARR